MHKAKREVRGTYPLNAVGDQELSIGLHQIMEAYHTDAKEFNPCITTAV